MAKAKRAWPAARREDRKPADLKPNPHNTRKHSKEQVDQLGRLFDRFGYTMPILIDEENMIIAGEGRWLMAKAKRIAEVPVMVAVGWSDEEKRAYQIADNKVYEAGGWDEQLLAAEVVALISGDADIDAELLGLAGGSDDAGEPIDVREIATSEVADEFWVSIRGPLKHQAAMLAALRKASKGLTGVSVELGTIEDE